MFIWLLKNTKLAYAWMDFLTTNYGQIWEIKEKLSDKMQFEKYLFLCYTHTQNKSKKMHMSFSSNLIFFSLYPIKWMTFLSHVFNVVLHNLTDILVVWTV